MPTYDMYTIHSIYCHMLIHDLYRKTLIPDVIKCFTSQPGFAECCSDRKLKATAMLRYLYLPKGRWNDNCNIVTTEQYRIVYKGILDTILATTYNPPGTPSEDMMVWDKEGGQRLYRSHEDVADKAIRPTIDHIWAHMCVLHMTYANYPTSYSVLITTTYVYYLIGGQRVL